MTNPRLLVALSALQYALFPIPIVTLFWKDHVGMSLTDIMILQAVFSLAVALLEPIGVLIDRAGMETALAVLAAAFAALALASIVAFARAHGALAG